MTSSHEKSDSFAWAFELLEEFKRQSEEAFKDDADRFTVKMFVEYTKEFYTFFSQEYTKREKPWVLEIIKNFIGLYRDAHTKAKKKLATMPDDP